MSDEHEPPQYQPHPPEETVIPPPADPPPPTYDLVPTQQTQAYPRPQPMYQQPTYAPVMAAPSNGQATAGLVLGILSCIFCFGGLLTFVGAVLAIVFGAAGRGAARRTGVGHGAATAGLVLGIVALCLWLIIGIFTLGLFLLI